jgi:hypothetical protein
MDVKIKLSENLRYFEDDATGLTLKKKEVLQIYPKHLRSAELRFLLLRNKILLEEGELEFTFRGDIIKVKPGKDGKNIIINNNEEKNSKVVQEKKEEVEIKIEPEVITNKKGITIRNKSKVINSEDKNGT